MDFSGGFGPFGNDSRDPHDPRYRTLTLDECAQLNSIEHSSPLKTQLPVAFTLGFAAFLTFCVMRVKWRTLYGARQRSDQSLPKLSSNFLGWTIDLWKIPDYKTLENVGLDSFVFLSFFRMAMRFCLTASFLGIIVVVPINSHFTGDAWGGISSIEGPANDFKGPWRGIPQRKDGYLYAYLVFVYLFSFLFYWHLSKMTSYLIDVRQEYLSKERSITDRTVRISGIPKQYQTEAQLLQFLTSLNIGNVDSIMICRNFQYLDELFTERSNALVSLERAMSTRNSKIGPIALPTSTADAVSSRSYDAERPMIRKGFMGIFGAKMDAIDYYEAKLRDIDNHIVQARQVPAEPTAMAFITFNGVQSAQIAAQALLQPRPWKFRCTLAPAPSDINWPNTYLSRGRRMFQHWSIIILVAVITFLWTIPVGAIAAAINRDAIKHNAPGFSKWLDETPLVADLVQGFAPTLIYSIFISLTPYIFDYLTSFQGDISKAEEELSAIRKNYFFNYVNYFLAFVVADTLSAISNIAKDTTQIPYLLAQALRSQSQFYVDLIVLQGMGMFPFRLLEFGTIVSYPYYKLSSKSPREKSLLKRPATFNYAFFLPQPILIYSICLFYSIVSPPILVFGLIYFIAGYCVYKYQLLYALEHPPHSSGRVWRLIYNRLILAILVYHAAMAGFFSIKKAYALAFMIAPLSIYVTITSVHQARTLAPFFECISLSSIYNEDTGVHTSTMEEDREAGSEYIHPCLKKDLEQPWTESNDDRIQ